jgi:ABC-type sugar transport system ATPase subunit
LIAVENLTIHQGDFALRNVSFRIEPGQYGVLMGKTGSGKTTILECICGLRRMEAGRITLAGRDVTGLKPAERNIGYVPQDSALFTTMTVRRQLAFSLAIRGWARDAMAKRVGELAELLGIAHLLDRKPAGLSGGETQRVALGRALAFRPPVLCMDEPLSALDDDTRQEMYELLETVRTHTGVTTLHVTHNRGETQRLADRLLVLEDGVVREAEVDHYATRRADAPRQARDSDKEPQMHTDAHG